MINRGALVNSDAFLFAAIGTDGWLRVER